MVQYCDNAVFAANSLWDARFWTLKATIVALFLIIGADAAAAEAFHSPQITFVRPDWNRAIASLIKPMDAKDGNDRTSLDSVNTATGEYFTGAASSSVPVLLPFDIGGYLRDRADAKIHPVENYLSGFRSTPFFYPGPAGYEAVFLLRTAEVAELADIRFTDPIFITISGFALIYDIPAPTGAIEMPARELEREFPGIRRIILENHLRHAFELFGVPYVVSIECFDGPARTRRLSCRQAARIASHFLRALRVVGGTARPQRGAATSIDIQRPTSVSPDFTYYGPGRLLPNTGTKGRSGVTDYTVYSNIRFPFAKAPAYANSQSFMNWGDCDQTGRVPGPRQHKGASYRCRVNSKPLIFDESALENFSYPWRDNFCEHRFFFVSQCPSGLGHQGQDIRPRTCKLRNEGADRCQAYQDEVVAVSDGMILRAPKQEGLILAVNSENTHLRFRYLHMNPHQMDEVGLLSGQRVQAGEIIGLVGNYNKHENGTTYHLHFEAQVPTRDGWSRINPYATLVSAYERLINARGQEIEDVEPQILPESATMVSETASPKVDLSSRRKHRHRHAPSRKRKSHSR